MVSVAARRQRTGEAQQRHGRSARSSTGPRSGPVTSCGNVVAATSQPAVDGRAGAVEGEEHDGERQPLVDEARAATRWRRTGAVTCSSDEDVTARGGQWSIVVHGWTGRRRRRWPPTSPRCSSRFGEHDVSHRPRTSVGELVDVVPPAAGGARHAPIATTAAALLNALLADVRRARRASSATRGGTGTCTSTAPTTRRGREWLASSAALALATRARRRRRRAVGRVRRRRLRAGVRPRRPRGRPALLLDDLRDPRAGPPPPCAQSAKAPGRASKRRCQRDGVSSDGPRLVLEHPAGEVAPAPRAGAGRGRGSRRGRRARWASTRPSARRHAVVGDEVVAHGALVARPATRRVERAGGEDRLGGQPPGEQRLADALAGHHVGGHRRVADEQHSTVGQRAPGRRGPGSATPCAGPRARAAGPSAARMCGRSSRPAHSCFMSWMRRVPSRSTPKPTLARPPGSGNDQA